MRLCIFRLIPLSLFFVLGPVFALQFTFVAPPFTPKDQAQRIYKPIINYINQITENKFIYKSELNWHTYLKNLRNGSYDLVFEEAHIVGWQVEKHNYAPLARLSGSAEVVILKDKQASNIFSLSDLAGYTVCSPPAPRLSHMLFQSQFSNPHRQPLFKVTGENKKMVQELYTHRCQAVVLPLAVYGQLDNREVSAKTRIMFQSPPIPNWTFNASPRIPVQIRDQLRAALLTVEGRSKTRALRYHFLRFDGLITAQANDYAEYASLLRGQWGFD